MTILITGATGLVGRALVASLLELGHEVRYFTTSDTTKNTISGAKAFHWKPSQNFLDEKAFEEVSTVIHLAGANLAKRWTLSYKREILESRLLSAQLLLHHLQSNNHDVKHFVSASGIGIYPNSLTEIYTEDHPEMGSDFLAYVVQQWEYAADRFQQLGIKVSKLRTGPVLSNQGGMLAQLKTPVKMGMGSSLGHGKQWISWIHIDDLIGLYCHIVENGYVGTFNATAPIAVTNSNFMKDLREKMNRKALVPAVPQFLLKWVLGEMHEMLISSQHVIPDRSRQMGYEFKYPQLNQALDSLLP